MLYIKIKIKRNIYIPSWILIMISETNFKFNESFIKFLLNLKVLRSFS